MRDDLEFEFEFERVVKFKVKLKFKLEFELEFECSSLKIFTTHSAQKQGMSMVGEWGDGCSVHGVCWFYRLDFALAHKTNVILCADHVFRPRVVVYTYRKH